MSRYCANCGTEVEDLAVFCPTCGQPIDQASETEIPAAPAWPEPLEAVEAPEPPQTAGQARSEEPTRNEVPPPPPAATPAPQAADHRRPRPSASRSRCR